VPVIVAESLERVDVPLETMLRPSWSSRPADVVGQIVRGLARPRDQRPTPDWLRPEQRAACSHLLPILDRYHCSLLADAVGSGKTYVALGVAAMWPAGSSITVLAPATILRQWTRTADSVGVPVQVWSHERLSRGSLPPQLSSGSGPSLVIVDESHHFRNPAARRYRHLAPKLIGRTVLLLSATPVVNTLEDLAAQLALGTRDDALLPFGVPSIRVHLCETTTGNVSTALGELIVAGSDTPGKPERIQRKEKSLADDIDLEARCRGIERLLLSSNLATVALIRTVLWRALASSDMALLGVLRRYRSLLCQARDAAESGRSLTRSALRSFVGEAGEQLVLWGLVSPPASAGDLILGDLDPLESLIEEAKARSGSPDEKCRRLASLLQDGRPTLVFAGARETVRYLRDQFPGTAWCTGEAAGIGFTRMARDDVLSWFRPGAPSSGGPRVLITTDVAAEGLDLQAAARVVHYDLPWTAVRIDQRNGRALRLGSKHDRVEVVRFDLPAPIEQRLSQLSALARKRRLPRKAGIDPHGVRLWTWREEIAARFGMTTVVRGAQYCQVQSSEPGVLAGFSLYTTEQNGGQSRLATILGYIDADGAWSEQAQLVSRMMDAALAARPVEPDARVTESNLRAVAGIVRQRLETLHLAQWSHHLSSLQTRAIARLNRLAIRAVHARKGPLLSSVERAVAFARQGHTAGEEFWLEGLLALPDAALIGEIRQCPEVPPRTTTIYSALLGVVAFVPSSSISTAR
jgi:superfamily II DNA or RNA helicase